MNLNHDIFLHKFDLSEYNFTIIMLLSDDKMTNYVQLTDFDLIRLEEFLPCNCGILENIENATVKDAVIDVWNAPENIEKYEVENSVKISVWGRQF